MDLERTIGPQIENAPSPAGSTEYNRTTPVSLSVFVSQANLTTILQPSNGPPNQPNSRSLARQIRNERDNIQRLLRGQVIKTLNIWRGKLTVPYVLQTTVINLLCWHGLR